MTSPRTSPLSLTARAIRPRRRAVLPILGVTAALSAVGAAPALGATWGSVEVLATNEGLPPTVGGGPAGSARPMVAPAPGGGLTAAWLFQTQSRTWAQVAGWSPASGWSAAGARSLRYDVFASTTGLDLGADGRAMYLGDQSPAGSYVITTAGPGEPWAAPTPAPDRTGTIPFNSGVRFRALDRDHACALFGSDNAGVNPDGSVKHIGMAARLRAGAWRNIPNPTDQDPIYFGITDGVAGPDGCRTILYSVTAPSGDPGIALRTRDYRAATNDWAPFAEITTGGSVRDAVMDAAADGTQVIAFRLASGAVKVVRRAPGGTWSTPETLRVGPTGGFLGLDVAPDASAAVWWIEDGSLRVAQGSASGAWAAPATVAPVSLRDSLIAVAAGDGGRAVAAWTGQQGAGDQSVGWVATASTTGTGWQAGPVTTGVPGGYGTLRGSEIAVGLNGARGAVVFTDYTRVLRRDVSGVDAIGATAPQGPGGSPSVSPVTPGASGAQDTPVTPAAVTPSAPISTPAPAGTSATARTSTARVTVRAAAIARLRRGASTRLTARFTLARPAGRARLTVRWSGPGRTAMTPAKVGARSTVVSVMAGRLRAGTWTCTLRADGRVVRTVRVRIQAAPAARGARTTHAR